MANEDSWFTKWLRNGRLSGLTFVVLLITYIACTVFKIPTNAWDPLLLLSGGAFIGNLALKKDAEDRQRDKRMEELEKKVEGNESTK